MPFARSSAQSAPAKVTHRVAAVLLALFFGGHTVGTLRGASPAPEADVALSHMRADRFAFHGVERTMSQIFLGTGLVVSIALFAAVVLAWRLSRANAEQWTALAPVAWGLAAAVCATSVIARLFFFPGPAALSGLAGVLLVIGNMRMRAR